MAAACTYPRQVVLVTSSYKGKCNVCTTECYMSIDSKPPFVSIALPAKSFTLEIITRSGEFVVAAVGENLTEATRLAKSVSGKIVDKFSEGKIETVPASLVAAPLVRDAVANIECRVISILNCGNWALVTGENLKTDANEKMNGMPLLFCDAEGKFFTVGKKEGAE
ncbi:hypothetical protein COV61_04355 [Candidatus Micrarchaeota archaeon CG11_big_fil_rev_8_21_14_0_20_47_5]|nr:MAG: hypothetical protein AUJ17_03475 [Candidatus Micrarchaeota archaeon CG1_02_47_40]PIN83011.1 MAG: hypothetical protein COV61_04355 [Candidatus Micrarchaeota archaeon CG11_big_fil_rev_8_21_14_0_20_47_5]